MRRGDRSSKRIVRLGLGLTGGVVIVLALAQVFLPKIAASRISSRVGRYGHVESVSVKAWPAIKLLWGSVDSVKVRASSLSLEPPQAAKLLWEARGVARMDMAVEEVKAGPLKLSDATLSKRGGTMSAIAHASEADVKAALPEGVGVRLLRSEAGQVEVQASGGLFGLDASLDAVALAHEGKLVVHPLGFLVEGLQLTLFSEPHVYVEGVGASREGGPRPGYRLTMRASLR
jgi:hypothetical protein